MVSPLGRVIEISSEGQSVAKKRGFMVIEAAGREVGRVPLDDIAALVVTARDACVTIQLLSALSERGIPIVLTGADFQPSAMVYPLVGHHAQGERFRAQVDAARPLMKQLWTQIVVAKVLRQGWALRQCGIEAGAFERLARSVRSGDPDNIEAQAARRYWPLMMGREFRRDTASDGANAMLNYGYAVTRAAVARAICAAGLSPGLGVFHRNRSNPMPLADDLMEPFRPFVDVAVARLNAGGASEVTTEVKRALVALLWSDVATDRGVSPLSTAIHRCAGSLAESFLSGKAALTFPLLTDRADGQQPERIPDHVDGPDV
jgi:CRISPR-associated protein Cas1